MAEVLPEARTEMSDFAPRIITIKINPEKIREIIGKGGSMIRKIQEETPTEINVEDDGTVEIAAVSGENSRKAIQWIERLTREVEVGALYMGKVTRIMGFGAFVEILPGKEGLVRIGELADYHVPPSRTSCPSATRSWSSSSRSTARAGSTCRARPRCSATWPRNRSQVTCRGSDPAACTQYPTGRRPAGPPSARARPCGVVAVATGRWYTPAVPDLIRTTAEPCPR